MDGVLEAMGSVASGISPDDAIFIPYVTGIKYLAGENVNPNLTILAENVDQTDKVIAAAEELLMERYPNSSFECSDAGSKMDATGTIFGLYPAYKASKLVPADALNAD